MLLVDDQPLLRVGLRMVLESQADLAVVGEAGDGAEAVRLTVELDPDVVLMDVRMPGMGGIEATLQIVASGSRSRVLMLTTLDLDEYAFAAVGAGASGFLLKDVPPSDLLTGIRAVASGDAIVARSATLHLLDGVSHRLSRPAPAGVDSPLEGLSTRERGVLVELARGLSNAEIAERLVLSEATVKKLVGRILAQLDLRDRVQVVVFAHEIGLTQPSQS